MKLTVLGSGTGWLKADKSATSFFLSAGKHNLLFDIGPGTLRRLLESGHSLNDIDYVFLSHFHPDHSSDLVSLLFSARYRFGFDRKRPVCVIAAKGLKRMYAGLKKAYGRWVDPKRRVVFKEINKRTNLGRDLVVETHKMPHKKESIAFKIKYNGKVIVYTGDTEYPSPSFMKFAKGADLLIIECSLPDEATNYSSGHLTPSAVAEVAEKTMPKRMMLIHLYPQVREKDALSTIKKHYKGRVIIAKDLMKLKV